MSFKGKFGPLLIAEIGGNHEGDFSYANELLDLAINSKADVVKFQIYYPETLVNKDLSPDRYDHFKKFTFTPDQHMQLAQKCIDAQKKYLASVWDTSALEWIDDYLNFYKIGSGDLTAYPIIERIVEKNKPIILSTGLSSLKEINDSVRYIRKLNSKYNDPNMLALLQCTSMYPIEESEANLNVLELFSRKLNTTVGYSDHTEEIEALVTAATVGAQILEFHFTDKKKGKTFRDHKVSLTSSDIDLLIDRIKRVKSILGIQEKCLTESELRNKHHTSFRRALFPSRDIKMGEIVTYNDFTYLRPNVGIDAREADSVFGKMAKRNIVKLQVLDHDMFE